MEGDAANRWPAYSFTFDDLNTFISSKARRHQRWLISFVRPQSGKSKRLSI